MLHASVSSWPIGVSLLALTTTLLLDLLTFFPSDLLAGCTYALTCYTCDGCKTVHLGTTTKSNCGACGIITSSATDSIARACYPNLAACQFVEKGAKASQALSGVEMKASCCSKDKCNSAKDIPAPGGRFLLFLSAGMLFISRRLLLWGARTRGMKTHREMRLHLKQPLLDAYFTTKPIKNLIM